MEIEELTQTNNCSYNNLPLVEKHRPKELKSIISHEEIISTLQKFVDQNTIPHLLFHGPAGTGKTSTAMAIAKEFYSEKDIKHMVLELNASDDRGITVVREDISGFCGTSSLLTNKYKFKLVILDEVDMMITTAQAALRRIIEKYSTNVRFILVCNQVNKIIPAVQSRCLRFRFTPLKPEDCLERVISISNNEGYTVEGDAKNVYMNLIALCKGDMRRILNLMESCALSNEGIINEERIYFMSGRPSDADLKNIKKITELPFYKASNDLFNLQRLKGFTIPDLIDIICKDCLSSNEFKIISIDKKIEFFQCLQKLDLLSQMGGNERICLNGIISSFKNLRIK